MRHFKLAEFVIPAEVNCCYLIALKIELCEVRIVRQVKGFNLISAWVEDVVQVEILQVFIVADIDY